MAWIESAGAEASGVLVLSVAIACSPTEPRTEPSSTAQASSVEADTSAAADATASDTTNGMAGTSGVAPDGTCTEDSQCGMLDCVADRCEGCSTWEDCPAGLLCWLRVCYPAEDVPRCHAVAAPVCGDGLIGALEECDGGPGCVDCQRDDELEEVIHDAEIEELYVAPGGVMFTLDGPARLVTRWDADGTPTWSADADHQVSSLTTDPNGAVYLAGGTSAPYGFPRVDAWEIDSTPRWSVQDPDLGFRYVVATDDTRVVVGGITEQDNSPWGRGFLAQYDLDGALAWSRKLPEWSFAGWLALDGDEATVLGGHLYGPTPWTLLRIDGAGETRWSLELPVDGNSLPSVSGMVGDGEGGSWIFGQRDEGPWAVRHDAAGAELDVLDCFSATTGYIRHAAVAPSGAIAFAVVVSPGPIPTPSHRLWVAVMAGGEVTRGLNDSADDHWESMGLGWRPDGRLAIGLRGYYPNDDAVVVVAEL